MVHHFVGIDCGMNQIRVALLGTVFSISMFLFGCTDPDVNVRDAVDFECSPEFARLDMLIGRWEAASEVTMIETGERFRSSAKVQAAWTLGRQFILVRTEFDLDMPDEKSAGSLGLKTWDTNAGVYRTWDFDSWGKFSTGTMTYDEAARTWHMTSQWVNRRTGASGRGEGTMAFVGKDEKVITWTSRPNDGKEGGFRVKGRSRRLSDSP